MIDLIENLKHIKKHYVEASARRDVSMAAAQVDSVIAGAESMQQEIERLKARLERQAVDWRSIIDESAIKAQGIEDALSAVGCPYGDDTIGLHNWLEEYADNLRTKEG